MKNLISKIQVGGTDYGVVPPAGLTEEQQAQARQNIGAISAEDADVVRDGTYPDMTVGKATHAESADSAINATNAVNATNATNSVNAQKATADGNGDNIPQTYVKISDFDRLILENEYPVGGRPYIQFEGMQTPAQRWAGTSWEINTDYTGRVLVGSGAGYTLGATGGEETHTLSLNELTKHSHGGIRINWNDQNIPLSANSLVDAEGRPIAAKTNTESAHASIDYPDQITQDSGSSTPFNIMQPYKVVAVWKRTA